MESMLLFVVLFLFFSKDVSYVLCHVFFILLLLLFCFSYVNSCVVFNDIELIKDRSVGRSID